MAENAPALNTASTSIQALGRGFDLTSDIRFLYCKGAAGSRLVVIDEENTKDLAVYQDLIIPNVSIDIARDEEEQKRIKTGVRDFHQMSEFFNQVVSLSGEIPRGSLNVAFNFSGSWESDAASTKSLAMEGVFISLYSVRLAKVPLVLCPEVKRAVPNTWEPAALASFIENFGTHIITSVTVGGGDLIYVKQHPSSSLSSTDIENYVEDIANQRFSESEINPGFGASTLKDKDVTIIFRRRGGDDLVQSHNEWKKTVHSAPDVINMKFVPVISLLEGLPGKDHLKRAIDLYLGCKSYSSSSSMKFGMN